MYLLCMYYVYLLESTDHSTYVGATVDLEHRLRQHNKEIKGGAVATSRKVSQGQIWKRRCHVTGFPSWQAALQFEWAWKFQSRKLSPKLKPMLRKAAKGCGAGRGLGRKLRRGAVAAAGEAKSEAASHAANFRLVILSLISTHILRLGRFKFEIRLCNA